MSAISRRAICAASVAAVSTTTSSAVAAPVVDAPLLRLCADLEAADERHSAACLEEDELEGEQQKQASAAVDAAWARWEEIAGEIAETPAESHVGVALKMRIVKRGIEQGFADMEKEVAESLFEDVHRLAGLPLPAPPAEPVWPEDGAEKEWEPPAWLVASRAEGARLRGLGLAREGGFLFSDVVLLDWLTGRVAKEMGEEVAAKVREISTIDLEAPDSPAVAGA